MFRLSSLSYERYVFFRTVFAIVLFFIFANLLFQNSSLFFGEKIFFINNCIGLLASLFLLFGFGIKFFSFLALVSLTCITSSNSAVLRVIPGYLGYFLIFILLCNNSREKWKENNWLIKIFILVITFSFSYSGFVKLQHQAWQSGGALKMLIENPRLNSELMSLFFINDFIFQLANYIVVFVELIYFPLFLFYKTRRIATISLLLLFLMLFVFMNIKILLFVVNVFILFVDGSIFEDQIKKVCQKLSTYSIFKFLNKGNVTSSN